MQQNPRVSIVRCPCYEPDLVARSVARAAVLLKVPLEAYFREKKVLIKPNMLAARPPSSAVTTHPEVLRSLIGVVRGAGGMPCVGDSPALGDFQRVARVSGLGRVCTEEDVPLVEFNRPVTLPVPRHFTFKRLEVAAALAERNTVILNAPKLKTHQMMVLTGAVKNMFGAVCGLSKGGWHFRAGRDRRWFARMLVELAEAAAPALTVMDAVQAMEGEGPGSGRGKNLGLVLASTSTSALDAVCAELMGLKWSDIPTLCVAAEMGIPGSIPDQVEVVGEALEDVRPRSYELPGSYAPLGFSLPALVRRMLLKISMPRPAAAHPDRCTRCRSCVEMCPARCLTLAADRPVINRKQCIGCFCCSEVCPEKVFVSRGGSTGRVLTSLSGRFFR